MEDMEKKADEMLDEETESTTEEENKPAQKGMSPEEAIDALRRECRGTLRLMVPFKARGEDVKEVPFDFCALTGTEMMDALDEVPVNNILAITNAQAMSLFAAAAAKCAPRIDDEEGKGFRLYDAKDIRKRLSGPDSTAAVRIAKLFYSASGQAGANNIWRG